MGHPPALDRPGATSPRSWCARAPIHRAGAAPGSRRQPGGLGLETPPAPRSYRRLRAELDLEEATGAVADDEGF
eukprot:5251665-Alexandrium_andersonii.AAC.1